MGAILIKHYTPEVLIYSPSLHCCQQRKKRHDISALLYLYIDFLHETNCNDIQGKISV